MNATGTVWHSTWALDVSQSYTVTAKAVGRLGRQGKTVTQTSAVQDPHPGADVPGQIFEGYGATYGVGMPIILTSASRSPTRPRSSGPCS